MLSKNNASDKLGYVTNLGGWAVQNSRVTKSFAQKRVRPNILQSIRTNKIVRKSYRIPCNFLEIYKISYANYKTWVDRTPQGFLEIL